MFRVIKTLVVVVLTVLVVAILEFGLVLPLSTALIHARFTAPPPGTWFEGNDLHSGLLESFMSLAGILCVAPLFVWALSRFLIPNKDRRIRVGRLSAVCFPLFGLSVVLEAVLGPAHQYQVSSEGITFAHASDSRGALKWSDVTSIELACIYNVGGRHSPGYYEPSLVLHFADATALDLWAGARRANNFTNEKTYVEDFLHHFGEVVARLPPAALANTVHHNNDCLRDFKKLQQALPDPAQQGR